jgi:hypothetical protein
MKVGIDVLEDPERDDLIGVIDRRFLREPTPTATGITRPRKPFSEDIQSLLGILPPGWRGASLAYSVGHEGPVADREVEEEKLSAL